jgi:hypothetical protein
MSQDNIKLKIKINRWNIKFGDNVDLFIQEWNDT